MGEESTLGWDEERVEFSNFANAAEIGGSDNDSHAHEE